MTAMNSKMNFKLALALGWLSQVRGLNIESVLVDRVHTDTRTLRSGDLFVALRGERFDAHDFLPQAAAAGAVAASRARCSADGKVLAMPSKLRGFLMSAAL